MKKLFEIGMVLDGNVWPSCRSCKTFEAVDPFAGEELSQGKCLNASIFEWQWVTECLPTWLFRWHLPIKANQSLLLWWHQPIPLVSSEVWHEENFADLGEKSGHFCDFGHQKTWHFWEKFNNSWTTGSFPAQSRSHNNNIPRYSLDFKVCMYE